MVEKVTPKELDRMMDKMFSISPEWLSVFQEYFSDLIQTEEGSRLLRSLDENFNGEKITVKFQESSEMPHREYGGCGGYFSPDRLEIVVRKPSSKFSADALTPGTLFHELTHWDQNNNRATPRNTLTRSDAYFAAWMEEADARVSTFFFAKELSSRGNWLQRFKHRVGLKAEVHQHDYSDPEIFVRQTQSFIRSRHADWTDEQVQKETKKQLLISVLRETNLDSFWHRYYDKTYTAQVLPEEAIFSEYALPKGRPFMDIMEYYMEKYGLTPQECLDLRQETISKSSIRLPKQENRQVDEHTMDIYQDGIRTHRIVKKAGETEVEYPEDSLVKRAKCVTKSDGTTVLITQSELKKSVSICDKMGRVISREEYDSQEKLVEKRRWDHSGKEPYYEEVSFEDGKLFSSKRSFGCGEIFRSYKAGSTRIYVQDHAVMTNKNGDVTYCLNYCSRKCKLINGEFVGKYEHETPPTSEELKILHNLADAAKKVEQLDSQYPSTFIKEAEQAALDRDIPSVRTQNLTNSEMLSQASTQREQSSDTPRAPQKLDPMILSHFSHGGNGG